MTFLPHHPKPDDGGDGKLPGVLGGFINKFAAAAASDVGHLLRHAQRGDLAGVQAQLAKGVSPNACDDEGNTALHVAARANHAAVIAHLIAAGANPQVLIKDKANTTPLHEAINFGREAAAEELIRLGAFRLEAAGATTTLLHRAAEKGKARIIKALLDAGADPFLPTATGVTALSAALNAKQSEAVRVLMEAPQVAAALNHPLEGADNDGRTPFHMAVMRGDAALVHAMIDAGAFVHKPTRQGMTPLLLAINRGDSAIVEALLARGADVFWPVMRAGARGEQIQPAPLMYLCGLRTMAEAARTDILRQLVAAGADPNGIDAETGEFPLHVLMSGHNIYSAMGALLEAGANPSRRNRRGATPLMLAVERASMHEMTNLLAAGVDPDARHAQDGRTALMMAAALGQPERMSELLQAGADPRAADHAGKTVADYMAENARMLSLTRPVLEAALAKPPRKPLAKPAGPGPA